MFGICNKRAIPFAGQAPCPLDQRYVLSSTLLKSIESVQLEDQLKTYRDPSLPLAPSIVPAIARWIEAASAAR